MMLLYFRTDVNENMVLKPFAWLYHPKSLKTCRIVISISSLCIPRLVCRGCYYRLALSYLNPSDYLHPLSRSKCKPSVHCLYAAFRYHARHLLAKQYPMNLNPLSSFLVPCYVMFGSNTSQSIELKFERKIVVNICWEKRLWWLVSSFFSRNVERKAQPVWSRAVFSSRNVEIKTRVVVSSLSFVTYPAADWMGGSL